MAATTSSSSAASAAASAAAAVLGPLARLLWTAGEGRPMGCISKEDRPPRRPAATPAGTPAGASADSGRPLCGRLFVSMRAHLAIQLRWLPPDRDEPLAVPALSWYLLGRDSRLPRLAAAPSAAAAATAAAAACWSALLPSCTSMAVWKAPAAKGEVSAARPSSVSNGCSCRARRGREGGNSRGV